MTPAENMVGGSRPHAIAPTRRAGWTRPQRRRTTSAADLWFLLATTLLVLSIVWPRYAFVKIGPLAGLSPFTLTMTMFLALGVPWLIVTGPLRQALGRAFLRAPLMISLLLAWFAWRLVCDAQADAPMPSIAKTLREGVYLGGMFFVGLLVAAQPQKRRTWIRALLVCILIAEFAGILERATRTNILVLLGLDLSGSIGADAWANLTEIKYRAGAFRGQSVFNHPIVFGQFLAATAPFSLYVYQTERGRYRWLALGALVLAPLLLILTGSRGAIPSMVIAVGVYLIHDMRKISRKSSSGAMAVSAAVALVLAIGFGGIGQFQQLVGGKNAIEAGSTTARLQMMDQGMRALASRPLVGYGDGLSPYVAGMTGRAGIQTIDSYPLTVAVEFGFVGLFLYVSLLLTVLTRSIGSALRPVSENEARFAAALAGMTMGVIVTSLVLSIPDNTSLIYFAIPLVATLHRGAPPRSARPMLVAHRIAAR